jgi:hypothetical protein
LKSTLFPLLLLCFSFTANGDCPDAIDSKLPIWVEAGFGYQEPGYYYGFGEARMTNGLSYGQLLMQAEQQARQDLVNSIHIKVEASTGISTLIENGVTGERIRRRSENKIQTSSKLDLPGLPIHQQWQDADSCSVYVQVRIDNPMVTLVLQRTQAEAYLSGAQNETRPVKLRLFSIDEAIRLANHVEFNQIPAGLSSSQMLRKFKNVRDKLLRVISRSNHAFFIVNDTHADDTEALNLLRTTMESAMSGSFETGKECSSPAICLNHAGSTSANYASVAVVRMKPTKQNGFWVGNFEIEVSLWDLADNTRIYNSGVLAVRVMNRHQHKLTLNGGFNKWLQLHTNSLAKYQQKASAVN